MLGLFRAPFKVHSIAGQSRLDCLYLPAICIGDNPLEMSIAADKEDQECVLRALSLPWQYIFCFSLNTLSHKGLNGNGGESARVMKNSFVSYDA
jgi:hypothetical protein